MTHLSTLFTIQVINIVLLMILCYHGNVKASKNTSRSHPSIQIKGKDSEANCSTVVKVFITGINGMIGSHVARELSRKKCYNIHGLIRLRADLTTLQGILYHINFFYGDVTDGPRMRNIIDTIRPDVIYHFAAQAVNGISFDMPKLTMDINVQGTMNIFEALQTLKLKPRVLFAGSSTEYGNSAKKYSGQIPESAELDPVSPYGISKVAGEMIANQFFTASHIPVVTARLFIQIGTGGVDFLAIHQFCKQIVMAEMGLVSRIIRHGNLNTSRDMTAVSDSAKVLIFLAENGIAGEAYNVGSGTSITMKSLLEMAIGFSTIKLETLIEKSRLRVFDEMKLVANITKIQRLTGWIPATDMSSSVKTILNYWRSKVRALYCDTDTCTGNDGIPKNHTFIEKGNK